MGIPRAVRSAASVPEVLNAVRARGDSLFVVMNQPDTARERFCGALRDAIPGLRPRAAAGVSIGEGRQ